MSLLRSATLAVGAALLAGVSSLATADAPDPNARPAAAARKPAATAQKKNAKLVTAPPKHNGSGVVLRYGVPSSIKVGEASTVRLELSNITSADGAQVEVRQAGGGTQLASYSLRQGEVRNVDLAVPAQTDGMHYLDVFSTQDGRTSVQSVPLRVGSGKVALKTEGELQTTPSGEKIIVMPASR